MYKKYAEKYFELGLNVNYYSHLPSKFVSPFIVDDKYIPSNSWILNQVHRQEENELDSFKWNLATGVGCSLGYGIRCIELVNCDSHEICKSILKEIGLKEDYEWTIKTPNGFQILIYCIRLHFTHSTLKNGMLTLPPNEKYANSFSKINFKWAGHCILPPTNIDNYEFSFIRHMPEIKPSIVDLAKIYKTMCLFSGSLRIQNQIPLEGELRIKNFQIKINYDLEYKYHEVQLLKDSQDLLIYDLLNEGIHHDIENYLTLDYTIRHYEENDYENYPEINWGCIIRPATIHTSSPFNEVILFRGNSHDELNLSFINEIDQFTFNDVNFETFLKSIHLPIIMFDKYSEVPVIAGGCFRKNVKFRLIDFDEIFSIKEIIFNELGHDAKNIGDVYYFLFKEYQKSNLNGFDEANMLWMINRLLIIYGHFN